MKTQYLNKDYATELNLVGGLVPKDQAKLEACTSESELERTLAGIQANEAGSLTGASAIYTLGGAGIATVLWPLAQQPGGLIVRSVAIGAATFGVGLGIGAAALAVKNAHKAFRNYRQSKIEK